MATQCHMLGYQEDLFVTLIKSLIAPTKLNAHPSLTQKQYSIIRHWPKVAGIRTKTVWSKILCAAICFFHRERRNGRREQGSNQRKRQRHWERRRMKKKREIERGVVQRAFFSAFSYPQMNSSCCLIMLMFFSLLEAAWLTSCFQPPLGWLVDIFALWPRPRKSNRKCFG